MEYKTSAEKIILQYKEGHRTFVNLNIHGDFQGQNLKGISFDKCFLAADFKYCNLIDSTFKNGNIKTSDFRYSNLTNATFFNLGVESSQFDWAETKGILTIRLLLGRLFSNWRASRK